jgi:cell division topological specificity factor
MSILKLLSMNRKSAAKVARERLQIVLSHERSEGSDVDFLPKMRNELMAVISKYVRIDQDQINVQLQRTGTFSVLELNITLPTPALNHREEK